MALVYIEKVTTNRAAFEAKVIQIASRLKMQPDWLMTVMYAESKLDHTAKNPYPGSTAYGLIQFTSQTAKAIGTSTEALKKMNNIQQLDWVEKFFKTNGVDRYENVYDVYFGVFHPRATGLPDSTVLFIEGGTAYEANKGLDTDKDGKITVANVKAWFSRFIKEGTDIGSTPSGNNAVFAGLGLGLLLLLSTRDNG